MDRRDGRAEEYVVPTYLAPEDTVFYHFLHGSVPGHQIDFIYQPAVPQGALSRQHFGHLARVIKFIEPRENSSYAFSIANLSRDDTQHEPGHGGLAILFGLRIRGETDHAGRRDPPFSHAIAAINWHLDAQSILHSALAFHRGLFPGDNGDALSRFYHRYAQCAAEHPEEIPAVLDAYIAGFASLPRPGPGNLSRRWTIENASPPKRIVIVHDDETLPFETLAGCAARIAAMLYVSDIRWTSITTGREADLPGGVAIRLIPRRDVDDREADAIVLPIEQVPQDEGEIATRLFGAVPVEPASKPKAMSRWREQIGARTEQSESANERPPEPAEQADSPLPAPSPPGAQARPPAGASMTAGRPDGASDLSTKRQLSRRSVWIGLVALGAALAIVISLAPRSDKDPVDAGAPLPSGATAVKGPSAQPSGAPVTIAPAVTTRSTVPPPAPSASLAPVVSASPVTTTNTSPATSPPSGKRSVQKPAATNDGMQVFDAPIDLMPNHEVPKP